MQYLIENGALSLFSIDFDSFFLFPRIQISSIHETWAGPYSIPCPNEVSREGPESSDRGPELVRPSKISNGQSRPC